MPLTPEERKQLEDLRAEVKEHDDRQELAKLQKSKTPERPWYSVTPGGVGQAFLNAIPSYGAVAGGLLGGVPGAGLGSAAGKSAQNFVEGAFLDRPKTREEIYLDPIRAIPEGMEQEMMGQILSAAPSHYAAQKSADAAAIEEAAKRLGTKASPGMLADKTGGYALRGLESTLEQSPTWAGSKIRAQKEPIYTAMEKGGEGLLEEASPFSKYETGEKIKSGIISNLDEKLSPIKESYSNIRESTPAIDLDPKSLSRVAKNIRNINEAKYVPSSNSYKVANDFATSLENIKTADDLLNIQSTAKAILRDPTADILTKQTASQIVDKLDRLQSNSIMRAGIESARTSGEGTDIAKGLINQIKETNRQYRGLKEKATEFGERTGLVPSSKTAKGFESFKETLSEVPSEKIPEKLFNTGDVNTLKYLQDQNQKAFELAKNQKLAEIDAMSRNADHSFNANKFLKITSKLQPEVKDLLFGAGGVQTVSDIKTLSGAIPGKVGASDTPRGLAFQNTLSPLKEVKGLLQLGQYKMMQPSDAASTEGFLKKYQPQIGYGVYNFAPNPLDYLKRFIQDEERK